MVLSRKELDFGKVACLKETRIVVDVTNQSTIDALFKTRIVDDAGVFRCENLEGDIKPGETLSLSIVARFYDPQSFKGKLLMVVQYLSSIVVSPQVTGASTSIVPSIPMDKIDLGFIFTDVPVETSFKLHNQGKIRKELR